jgi:integrase
MDVLIDRATARGRLARNEPGGCPEYLATAMKLAYLCRLRGIEVVTLTDANELEEGILTNRRKGSRDNIIRWTPRLRTVWEGAKALRARVWERRNTPIPIAPSKRFIIVASHGGPLRKTSLDTAWQRFITLAIADREITPDDRFALHDLKRRGITDTVGNRADKQEASGHLDAKMMDIYDLSIPVVYPSAE